jgi:hypothetical protein
MLKNFLSAGLLWFMWATSGLSCQFDTDCAIGSECVKAGGSLYGVCAGGTRPGNTFDDEPVYDPLDLDGSYGNTCRFDVDCGVSNVCVKERGSLRGVCVNG